MARWEASETTGTLDRRAVLLGLAALVVAGVAAGGAVAGFGTPPNEGLYRVAVSEESPFYQPVDDATALDPVPPGTESAVLVVADGNPRDRRAVVTHDRSQKGRAALSVYRDAVQRYNTRLMRAEPNETAAFPVLVTVEYVPQAAERPAGAGTPVGGGIGGTADGGTTGAGGDDTGGAAGDDAGGGGDTQSSGTGDDEGSTGGEETTGGEGTTGDKGTTPDTVSLGTADGETATPPGAEDEQSGDDDSVPTTPGGDGSAGGDGDGDGAAESGNGTGDGPFGLGFGLPDLGGGGSGGSSAASSLFTGQSSGSPASIAPPFPFGSLILAFVFLVPMNFVVQAYGSTVLDERIDRRGELLLVAPLSRLDIVAGKTLPYLLALVAATVLISVGVGGGVISVLAVLPVALVYLSATFLGAMFARSFKELTFVTVTITVFVTTYVFVPAIFTTVIPVALISPLTIVVRDLQPGGPVTTLGEYLFSTGPFYVAAGMLFLLGAGIYREEDMFTQRPVPLKFLDALDAQLRGRLSVAVLSAALIPFVLVAELLGIALLVAFPEELAVPVLLVIVAVVEETAKSIGLYAAFRKGRFERTTRVAVLLGVLSGVGFFVGEKATAIAQLVGLDRLPLGRAAFDTAGVGAGETALLLLAPLVLHTVATAVASVGAARSWRGYLAGLFGAAVIHYVYDFAVVVVFLG